MSALPSTAPIDRPKGRRGRRAWLAGLMLVAAVCVLVVAGEGGEQGVLWDGHGTRVQYRLDGPAWVRPTLFVTGAACVTVALVLWVARRRALVALGYALALLVPAAFTFALVERSNSGRVSRADLRAVSPGTSRADLEDVLGPPAGHATMERPRAGAPCLIYIDTTPRRRPSQVRMVPFCFQDDRVMSRAVP